MKRFLVAITAVAVLVTLTGWAAAHGPGARWMGMGSGQGMGPGHMGRGGGPMWGGAGAAGCPGMAAATDEQTATPITEEKAKALAQEYADAYLQGFTVDKVLPFRGRHHTMYSVELKGPGDEVRVLHVNPFGNVMPFGGPQRRGA